MKERSQIILLAIVLILICSIPAYMNMYKKEFTFYKAELSIDGNSVEERLYYKPDKQYHTLYRNFETPIIPEDKRDNPSRIKILQITCSEGRPYYEDNSGRQYIMDPYNNDPLTYTENNEYGCGFGSILGFSKGKEYMISARYELHPDTLIEYEGRYYIKFVAYGTSTHPTLNKNTLSISGTGTMIYSTYIFPSSRLFIYIPYEPADLQQYKILHESRIYTGNNHLILAANIIFALLPALLSIFVWRRYGAENVTGDYPEELSQYPKERKAWEVAAYFNPPFGQIGSTLLPAVMMDLYNRKIIDIKDKDKETYIKILKESSGFDELESKVMKYLKDARKLSADKEGYFNIEEANENSRESSNDEKKLYESYNDISEVITSKGKEYMDSKGTVILFGGMLLLIFLSIAILGHYMAIAYVVCIIIFLMVSLKTALFQKFNKDYYIEYQQWQGFKNYLSHLDSIPRTPVQGVVMWEKYLIYATSLGIGKKVLDTLKKMKAIDETRYKSYSVINSGAFASSINSGSHTSSSHSGGSFGGGGGGGMGGGGGGGR